MPPAATLYRKSLRAGEIYAVSRPPRLHRPPIPRTVSDRAGVVRAVGAVECSCPAPARLPLAAPRPRPNKSSVASTGDDGGTVFFGDWRLVVCVCDGRVAPHGILAWLTTDVFLKLPLDGA